MDVHVHDQNFRIAHGTIREFFLLGVQDDGVVFGVLVVVVILLHKLIVSLDHRSRRFVELIHGSHASRRSHSPRRRRRHRPFPFPSRPRVSLRERRPQ